MTAGQIALTRTTARCCCALLAILCGACSKKVASGQASGGPVASASSRVSLATSTRPRLDCVGRGTSFSLGPTDNGRRTEAGDDAEPSPQGEKADAESDGDSAADLPFGVTVGSAVGYAGGYVVTAVDARQGGSHAVLAMLDADVGHGRVLDLGRVYGDAEAPRALVRDNTAFLLVPDTDASGNSFRYGWVRGLPNASHVEWLGSLEQTVDDSPVFALAGTAATMTIAWDEVERKSRQSFVRWSSLDSKGNRIVAAPPTQIAAKHKSEPNWIVNTTGRDVDAEAPQLVAHGQGYWLAYLAAEPPKSKGSRSSAEAKSRTDASGPNDDIRAVDLGRRGIEVVPLDADGRANGKPIVVADRSAHVVTFDIETTADMGAIVAYRDADATPGVEAQVIEIARIRPDGGVERLHIDDERVGAGMPLLLVDTESASPANPEAKAAWLAVAGSAGETRLAELRAPGARPAELVDAPRLVGVEPMLRRGGSLLVARHRARLVEFERMDCTWNAGTPETAKSP